jgi:hypothetical protein
MTGSPTGWEAVLSSRYFKLPYPLDRAFGRRGRRIAPREFSPGAERLITRFEEGSQPDRGAYQALFEYFVYGWDCHRSDDCSTAAYPGLPGRAGRWIDEMEGFARTMPLFGAWVYGGRSPSVSVPGGQSVNVAEHFARGLISGTDPKSPGYWGRFRHHNFRIVQAADIALALWLFRQAVWKDLSEREQDRVVAWLNQVHRYELHDNNWHLFVALVHVVLRALGRASPTDSARSHYERFKTFHLGDGWFADGPNGKVDYYNAWGIHFALHWIRVIDPSWDNDFLLDVERRFLESYRFLIGPNGVPMLGRSICYRIAVATPLVLGHREHSAVVSAGEARRALDVTWRYFLAHGAVRRGTVTQGYFDTDARLLDNYSGPASCFWSLRSLLAAFVLHDDEQFWQSPGEALPVERDSYVVRVPATGWRILGTRSTGVISVQLPTGMESEEPLEEHGVGRRVMELVRGPLRPANAAAKYGRRFYHSDRPLGMAEPAPHGRSALPGSR